ncbi:phosphoesterase [Aliidiomarina sedimenti]|uniref:Phosphoesterase n=1 Tax=Aliidiomarina sedimenti TaxID=1933879 RepID=A0ABY0BYK1_9GAMM|nr:metallophosphoesterase [Aliidiomarina sedimenti]RUO29770.1 phosphoesterase [Aliidiomarina sedimenti]
MALSKLGKAVSGLILLAACGHSLALDSSQEPALTGTRIAFLPDVHFHDVYASFSDGAFAGIGETAHQPRAVLRTMQAQLHSTRLFNENYFALHAALDELTAQGVELVILPGDFSDDGQPLHLRGLQRLLQRYEQEHGMRFFVITGNHDPVRPYDLASGKPDFLGPDGAPLAIYSHQHEQCQQSASSDVICSDELTELGYAGIFDYMGGFGLQPQTEDIYWETPYSGYSYAEYNLREAQQASSLTQRHYRICREGAPSQTEDENSLTNCTSVSDASYLVEPVEGLWLLAIDANIYQPVADQREQLNRAEDFLGAGNAGYNMLLTHKPQVVEWIAEVVLRAREQGKQLIAFSHYPMAEFYSGMSPHIRQLFGSQSFQMAREPARNVSQVLADTGLQLHVAGHMHFNHTSVVEGHDGQRLVNIQAPSIAGYQPAYKLLTLHGPNRVEVSTPVLSEVRGFDRFFGLYQREHAYMTAQQGNEAMWQKEVLQSGSYAEFTEWHLHELARQRFLPNEWPQPLRERILQANGAELVRMLRQDDVSDDSVDIDMEPFESWQGLDLAIDFYRLRNAGTLGLQDIPAARLRQYSQLQQLAATTDSELGQQLAQLLVIFDGFRDGLISDHFFIDTAQGRVYPAAETD